LPGGTDYATDDPDETVSALLTSRWSDIVKSNIDYNMSFMHRSLPNRLPLTARDLGSELRDKNLQVEAAEEVVAKHKSRN
jgi:hypothetical protein